MALGLMVKKLEIRPPTYQELSLASSSLNGSSSSSSTSSGSKDDNAFWSTTGANASSSSSRSSIAVNKVASLVDVSLYCGKEHPIALLLLLQQSTSSSPTTSSTSSTSHTTPNPSLAPTDPLVALNLPIKREFVQGLISHARSREQGCVLPGMTITLRARGVYDKITQVRLRFRVWVRVRVGVKLG